MKSLKKIQNRIKDLILLSFSLLVLQSCNKDEYEVIGDNLPSATSVNNLFDIGLSSKIQVATFDASTTYLFTSEKGVKLTINGSCLRKNGNPVTGQVKLKFIEILDRGNMLVTNKPTMGLDAASNEKRLLISGGEFYIATSQDGVELTSTCLMDLSVPTSLTGGTDTAMLPFAGQVATDGNLTWEQATGVDFSIQTGPGGVPYYNLLFQNFGWFNCDRFANYTGLKTSITTFVPEGYANASFIFLSSKDFPNSLGKSFGKYPVGMECYIIFVTEKGGKFRYAIKPATPLTENHQVTFSLSETTLGTQAELVTALNALP